MSIIRNVPNRDMTERKDEKFVAVMAQFLTSHTIKKMEIEGIDLWHRKLTTMAANVDAKEVAHYGPSEYSLRITSRRTRHPMTCTPESLTYPFSSLRQNVS